MIAQMAETWRLLAEQRQRKLARQVTHPSILSEKIDPPQNDD